MSETSGKSWVAVAAALACLTVAPAASTPAPGEQSKRAGKVVRVERPRLVARAAIRICPVPFPDRSKGTCYGGAPAVGDSAALFDFDRNYLGELRVLSVGPSDTDSCQTGSIFDFTYEIRSPAPASAQSRIPYALSVFGMALDPARSRLITADKSKLPVPDTAGKAQPWMGVDQDGDDSVDMVVTAFECKAEAPPPPSAGAKMSETFCLDYWLGNGSSWTRARRDVLYTCM